MSEPDIPELVCSRCGYKLKGPPPEEIDDSDGEHNPDDPHFEEVERDSHGDSRLRCMNTGHMASIEPQEEYESDGDESSKEGGPGDATTAESETQPTPTPDRSGEDVFEFEETEGPEDILAGVVSNPSYGLSESQVSEVKDWAEIYDGQMSPDLLKNILKDMKGISKQQSELMSRKYEAKMSKYAREVSSEDRGPPMGGAGGFFGIPQSGASVSPNSRNVGDSSVPQSPPSPSPEPESSDDDDNEDDSSPPPKENTGGRRKGRSELRSERKMRRLERRDQAMQTVMDEAAEEFARENAKELGKGFFALRGVAITLLEKKAERDPEAFFELLEKYDIDIFEFFAEDSDGGSPSPETPTASSPVDQELDDIAESINNPDPPETDTDTSRQTQTQQKATREEPTSSYDEYSNDTQQEDTEEKNGEGFEDLFGDVTVEGE